MAKEQLGRNWPASKIEIWPIGRITAHQRVLVFVKGDARKATEAIGEVEFGEIPAADVPAGQSLAGVEEL